MEKCPVCRRFFKNRAGLVSHENSCKQGNVAELDKAPASKAGGGHTSASSSLAVSAN